MGFNELGIHKGMRQGCTLSPWLFNVFVDKVTKEARREFVREVKLSTGDVGMLFFADGMVIMAESEEGLQSNQALSETMDRWDLKVNWKKTKVICKVRIRDQVIKQVEEMKYLGVIRVVVVMAGWRRKWRQGLRVLQEWLEE